MENLMSYYENSYEYYDMNLSNFTSVVDDPLSGFAEDPLTELKIFMYSVVFLVGTAGNTLVIYIMLKKSEKRRLIDIFMTHLAVADSVFLITLPLWIWSFSVGGRWPFGDFLCKFTSYVIAVNMFSSIFFLTCMSVDRFMAVVLVLDTRTVRTKNYAHLTSLALWVASLGLGVPRFVTRATDDEQQCTSDASPSGTSFSLAVRVMGFLLPLAVIAFCYSAVAVKLWRHFQRTGGADRKAQRSVRVGLWILALFVVAWLPFNALVTVHTLQKSGHLSMSVQAQVKLASALSFATCLAFSHSCVNPLVYFALDKYVQRRALRLLPEPLRMRYTIRRSSVSTSITHPDRDSAAPQSDGRHPTNGVI
ncbi:G-protein coupled receptor 15-like [Megalops cyprinoides]|uniref:G-protein coupled receptor 15-like n=1 Tax=Megalops cyprinoides TaxID=118141 RepID=UPI0018650844|nr:G-protein coupled receptor 15-like [Megalops cyprinoides]